MGKVHGSLARAGKVKSQTPKVFKPMFISMSPMAVFLFHHFHMFTITIPIDILRGELLQVESQLKKLTCTGRTSRKEENPQGPRQEENYIYAAIRERHHDGWQAQGECDLVIRRVTHHSILHERISESGAEILIMEWEQVCCGNGVQGAALFKNRIR